MGQCRYISGAGTVWYIHAQCFSHGRIYLGKYVVTYDGSLMTACGFAVDTGAQVEGPVIGTQYKGQTRASQGAAETGMTYIGKYVVTLLEHSA